MKKLLFLLFLPLFTKAQCDSAAWQHIYNPYRLQVLDSCITVTGVIEVKRREKDGDLHILLRLDSGQNNLLNQVNMTRQRGCIVIEPACVNTVTQADAVSACSGFVNTLYIPSIGEHVAVTGSWVLDREHGWLEIHPISKIQLLK